MTYRSSNPEFRNYLEKAENIYKVFLPAKGITHLLFSEEVFLTIGYEMISYVPSEIIKECRGLILKELGEAPSAKITK